MVSGFVVQRAPGRDAGIPDWYSLSETETGAGPTSKNVATKESAASWVPFLLFLSDIQFCNEIFCNWNCIFDFTRSRCIEDFEILHGDLQGLTDTIDFLKSLSELSGNDLMSPKKQRLERTAASVLFDWEVLIWQSSVFILVNCRTLCSSIKASCIPYLEMECRIARFHKVAMMYSKMVP